MAHPPIVGRDASVVLDRLRWMRERRIWPNGRRYLWTDAFGVVLLVSLHRALGEDRYLEEPEWVVAEGTASWAGAWGSASGRPPIVMANTSITSPCGCLRWAGSERFAAATASAR